MSKNNLKDKIRKKTATQTFFNQYDDNKENTGSNKKNSSNNLKNNDDIDNDKAYVIDDNNNSVDNDIVVNTDDDVVNDDVVNDDVVNDDVVNDNSVIARLTPLNKESDEEEYLRGLVLGHKPKRKKANKVFTSFYMDPDLAEQVDKIVKNGVKGDKSKLINIGIRKLLQEYGVLRE